MNKKLRILGIIAVFVAIIVTGTVNAQEKAIEDALSSYGLEEPKVSISGNEVAVEYKQKVSELSTVDEDFRKIAKILTIVSNEYPNTDTVKIRIYFDDGQIMEINGKPEDGKSFLNNEISAEIFWLERLEFKPLTRGPPIVPGICEPDKGENCENCDECACYPNEICDPDNPEANERGCVVVHIPANSHLVGSEYVCDEGYEWNSNGTDCIPEKKCPSNAFKFQGECYCNPGYEWDSDRVECILKEEGDEPYLYVEDRIMEKTVEIPIMMCNAKELANMDLDWSYNASVLKLINVTTGSLNEKALFDWNEVSPGKLKIAFASAKGVTGSGSIAVMKFEVIGNTGDTSTLTGTVTTAGKTDGTEISVSVTPGEFTVGTPAGHKLVAYYPFNGDTQDHSGNGNHGTNHGATFVSGVSGNALSFDGKDDYISTDYTQNSVTAYTIEVWVKTTDSGNKKTFVQDRGSGAEKSLTLGMGQSGAGFGSSGQVFYILDSAGIDTGVHSVQTINDNNWHHVVGVWSASPETEIDPSQFKIYIDGVPVTTTSGNYDSSSHPKSPLTGLGGTKIARHDAWNTNFNGIIDEVSIYNYALTASEIKANYDKPLPTGVLLDDFNDNTINHTLWVVRVHGSGPTVAETNKRVEITIPADSSGEHIGAGYGGICKLRGDFDIQVDYELLVWPSANGVRVGLSAGGGQGHVERISFGGSSSDFPGEPREVYLTHFADGVHGITATSDLSGKLRLVRKGSMQTGYYFDSGSSNWIAIHSASITTADTPFSISAWSADYAFTDQEVKIAFDNLVVNQGEVICPGTTTPPPGWCDYFDSATLDPRWSWVREDPTHWSLTDHPGYLRITTQRGDLWQTNNDGKNLLLTAAPSGDFEVTTRVTIKPTANYHNAALFVYQDDDNYLDVARQYASMWGGQQVFLCKEVEGRSDVPHGVPCDLTTVYLKITKQNSTYTGYWSIDGSNWTKVYQYKDIKFSNFKIGFTACNGGSTAPEITADFDYICVAPVGAVPTPTPTPTPNGYSDFGTTEILKKGFKGNVYYLEEGTSKLPDFSKMTPVGTIYTEKLDIPPRDFKQGFPGITDRFEWFGISYIGGIVIPSDGNYTFKLTSDDGAKLYIDGELVIDNDGIHPPRSKTKEVHLTKGDHLIGVDYFQGPKVTIALQLFVETSEGKETPVKPVLDPSELEEPTPTPSGSGTSYPEATLTHSGFDFSEGTTGDSLINDGEIIFWQPGGGTHPSYPRDSGYLWWRNTRLDDVNRASQTKDMGAVDIATVREVPAEWDKSPLIPPLLMGHTIVAKCYDGYVKFQVISVDPADESARVKYLYSPDTIFDEWTPTLQPTPTPTPTPSPTPATPGEYECPQDAGEAYQQYIAAYNKLTSLMAEGKGDTPEAQEAYEEYKAAKACYESRISGTEP